MKKLLFGIITTFILTNIYAQKDKMATEILDAVIAKTKAQKTIKVDFTYTIKNIEADVDESKKGIIQILGDRYRLDFGEQIVISDSETMWTLLLEDKEVMINEIDKNNTETITPNNLLNSYSENYKSKFLQEDIFNNKTVEIIELSPLKKQNFTKIHVIIDKKEKLILNFCIYDINGSTYTYDISNYILNDDIPFSLFMFNEKEYADFEIIDMR